MRKYYSYLEDKTFLKEIDTAAFKTQYVKITVLNWDETPVQEIQGKIQNGSVQLNGDSSIRRTCNLTMIADIQDTSYATANSLISINKKINLEIGFLNTFGKYTDNKIIWFPLGLYVIAGASISHNATQLNISLTLKDKMCLLNGEFGGVIPAAARLDIIEEVIGYNEDGKEIISTTKLHIIEIIQYVLTTFGGELMDNIIINDIDPQIKRAVKWIGDESLGILKKTQDGSTQIELASPKPEDEDIEPGIEVEEYKKGASIGYVYETFYFDKEFSIQAGAVVTSVLDKIKSYLGNFEYYYDTQGKFIFQEIKNYLNTTQATDIAEKMVEKNYFVDLRHSKSVYEFDNKTASNFTNNPQYPLIKNDYIVWGARTSVETNNKLPIRYHLAIDTKPILKNDEIYYCEVTAKGQLFKVSPTAFTTSNVGHTVVQVTSADDWRTILYVKGWLSKNDKVNYYDAQADYYFPELHAEWYKLYNIETKEWKEDALIDPSSLDYYLDFITSLDNLSVSAIGRRGRVVNQKDVNCIFEPPIPDYVFIDNSDTNLDDLKKLYQSRGEQFIQISPEFKVQMATAGNMRGAFTTIQAMLSENTKYNESISFNAMPVYHLEPNSRVTVRDTDSQIYGDYIIKTISLPLDISGTMSISATRAIDRE